MKTQNEKVHAARRITLHSRFIVVRIPKEVFVDFHLIVARESRDKRQQEEFSRQSNFTIVYGGSVESCKKDEDVTLGEDLRSKKKAVTPFRQ